MVFQTAHEQLVKEPQIDSCEISVGMWYRHTDIYNFELLTVSAKPT